MSTYPDNITHATTMTSHKISDDERKQFRDAVSHVTLSKQAELPEIENTKTKKPEKISTQKIINKPRTASPVDKISSYLNDHQPTVQGETIISFAKSGVQPKRVSQIRQGKIRIEATLDLHEHTSDEAIHATENFLKHCQNNGFRTVCIIHGKGIYSNDNKPVIKNLLNHYLRQHPLVLAFHSEKKNAGALIVLLKI